VSELLEAAGYFRKSVINEAKDVESIEVQQANCDKAADSFGWTIPDHLKFIDYGISASKGLLRPDWLKMLNLIEQGKIKRIVVRDQARLSREDVELFIFLNTIDRHDVEVRDSYGRQIKNDLQTKVKGLVDADYAKSVAKNVAEKKKYQAEQGIHPKHRHRPYGYTAGYGELIEDEVKILREVAKRYLAGEGLFTISQDFTKRGIYKYTGKRWTTSDLSKLLKRPEYAGIRRFGGEEVAIGDWPCLWDKDQKKAEAYYRKLQAKLADNKPFATSTARKHLLAGILVCSECATTLGGAGGKYACKRFRGGCSKVTRNQKALDEFFINLTYEAIKRLPQVDEDVEPDSTEEEIAKIEAKNEETRQAYKAGVISLADWVDVKNDCDAKIAELRKSQTKIELLVDDAESFLKADVGRQRATIKQLFGVVGVKPSGKGVRFKPDQLIFRDAV
jgi:site-specific DNA recombinase